jgi:hypothetical protein
MHMVAGVYISVISLELHGYERLFAVMAILAITWRDTLAAGRSGSCTSRSAYTRAAVSHERSRGMQTTPLSHVGLTWLA